MSAVGMRASSQVRSAGAERGGRSVGAAGAEDRADGPAQDRQVLEHRPVVDVEEVEADRLVEAQLAAARDLPQPGHARPDAEAPRHGAVVERHLAGDLRSGADQAHVAAEHVEELGQLVDRVAAHPRAGTGDARVVLHLEEQRALAQLGLQVRDELVGVHDHRPVLQAGELLAVPSDPGLPEEDGAAVVEPDARGGEHEDRREAEDQEGGSHDVEEPLAPPRRGGSMCMSGSPPTGRTVIRSPEMSLTLGATTTWMSTFSRSQTIRRSSLADVTAPPAKN